MASALSESWLPGLIPNSSDTDALESVGHQPEMKVFGEFVMRLKSQLSDELDPGQAFKSMKCPIHFNGITATSQIR